MPVISIADLKALWVTEYTPTEDDYVDLFDSFVHKSEKNAASGVLALDQFVKFAPSFISGTDGTEGQGIIIDENGEFIIGDLATSGIQVILDNETIETLESTKIGTKYDVGLIQLNQTVDHADYTTFNLYQRLRYIDQADTTFSVDVEDMGVMHGFSSATTSRQATLPEIDNERWGAIYGVANIANKSTYQSVVSTSGSDLLPATRIKEISGNTDLPQFNIGSNRYYLFAMPKTGSVWEVFQQGTWDERLKGQLNASLSGTTITLDAERSHYWDVTSSNGALTLQINNGENGDLIQLDLLGGGNITTWNFAGHAGKTVKVLGDDGDVSALWGSGDNMVLIAIGRSQIIINIRELTTKS